MGWELVLPPLVRMARLSSKGSAVIVCLRELPSGTVEGWREEREGGEGGERKGRGRGGRGGKGRGKTQLSADNVTLDLEGLQRSSNLLQNHAASFIG